MGDEIDLNALQRRVLFAVQAHAREGVLPAFAEHAGLPQAEFAGLCEALGLIGTLQVRADAPPPELLAPLIELLWNHRSAEGLWTRLMAGLLASAAFGARHLWQDLGATGRVEVSALMQHHFRPLAERNVRNLKWKNHFFQCLGAELGRPGLRPPRCDGCDEQPLCFPATAPVVTLFPPHQGPT